MAWKTMIAAVLATVLLGWSQARAQGFFGEDIRYADAAGVLVMPFDATSGRVSFQIVSRVGGGSEGGLLATHWVYYAADCRHLADVFIDLTARDTVVVDPTHLQGQTQTLEPPFENHPQGPLVDLSGERGVVVVTAFGALRGVVPEIAGGWTIATTATSASFGGDAIGVSLDGTLPDPRVLAGGIHVPTFSPTTLTASRVIMITLEADGDVHPITRASAALFGAHVCCSASVTDNLEFTASVPDVCFDCVDFTAITPDLAGPGEHALLPDTLALTTAGFVHLAGCRSVSTGGEIVPLGSGDTEQFLVALHGQSVGPFGFVVTGKYSRALPPP